MVQLFGKRLFKVIYLEIHCRGFCLCDSNLVIFGVTQF